MVEVNGLDSYKGSVIKKWIDDVLLNEENMQDTLSRNYDVAWELNREYYNKDYNPYTPNNNVYYYVEYFKNYKGFKEAKLVRDYNKSPKKY